VSNCAFTVGQGDHDNMYLVEVGKYTFQLIISPPGSVESERPIIDLIRIPATLPNSVMPRPCALRRHRHRWRGVTQPVPARLVALLPTRRPRNIARQRTSTVPGDLTVTHLRHFVLSPHL
jgi:hypothetical protein